MQDSSNDGINVVITVPKLTRKRVLVGLGGLMMSVILAAGAIIYIRQYTALAGLPREQYQDLSFPVYFPVRPPGFKLDPGSINSRSFVLSYKFTYDSGAPVLVSISPLDPKLDTNTFRPTREITTKIGKGYLVEYDERTTIAIPTEKSFVLINAPEKIPAFAIEQFASSLRQAR